MRTLAFAPIESTAHVVTLSIVRIDASDWSDTLGTVNLFRGDGAMSFKLESCGLTITPEDIAEVQRFRDPSYE